MTAVHRDGHSVHTLLMCVVWDLCEPFRLEERYNLETWGSLWKARDALIYVHNHLVMRSWPADLSWPADQRDTHARQALTVDDFMQQIVECYDEGPRGAIVPWDRIAESGATVVFDAGLDTIVRDCVNLVPHGYTYHALRGLDESADYKIKKFIEEHT